MREIISHSGKGVALMDGSLALPQARKPRLGLSGRLDRMRDGAFSQLLLAPVYLFVLVGLGFPILYSLYLSLFDLQLTRLDQSKFVGLGNYIKLFSDPLFMKAVPATIIFMIGSTALSVVLAVALALLLNQPVRGRTFYRVVLLIPWAVPPVVNSWMWLWIYNYNFGALNALLKALHLSDGYTNWLGHVNTAFLAMIVAESWKAMPFLTLLLLAKLLDIPKNLYKAGKIDGATVWGRFRHITLPGIRQTLMVVIILQSMWSLKAFDLIFVLTKGQPNDMTSVLNYLVYLQAFHFNNLGYAAAIAWFLSFVVVVLTAVYMQLLKERE